MHQNKLKKTKVNLGPISSCIICKNKNFKKWATKDFYVARKCVKCGMISVNPRPSEKDLLQFYQCYYDKNKNAKKLWKQRQQTYLIDKNFVTRFVNHGKVLDIGCSGGQFLETFSSKKWQKYGVEVEKKPAQHAIEKFGIDVKIGDIAKLKFSKKFDLIMLRGVIEHFSNPIDVLKKSCDLLKSGCFLFITATPVGNSFAFDVFREKWSQFVPPLHLHFFTVPLLTKILKNYGLELFAEHYQYEETPYANPQKDFLEVKKAILLSNSKRAKQIKTSPPFPGSMMTAIWKKSK